MGRLVVLVTSPRLPAGLLSANAWARLRGASLISAEHLDSPLALALAAAGLAVEAVPASASALLSRAADAVTIADDEANAGADVVWLAGDDGDHDLMRQLATEVVERAGHGTSGPEVELMIGSYDPVGARLLDLVEVMDRLRSECPWDRSQTHESLVRYLVEETYETVEAIETGDGDHLREELGDLLLQVVFHARLAQEDDTAPFGIDEVAGGIVEKLIRRHPHVFVAGQEVTSADGVQTQWDQIKATEKSRASALDGIPPGLPALSLAEKLLDRSPESRSQPPADAGGVVRYTEQSLGEALFTIVSAAHAAGLDPERALRLRVRREMAQVRDQETRATPAATPEPG